MSGPLGILFYRLAIFLRLFDRGVEKVTNGYAGILSRIVTRRSLAPIVIMVFLAGIYLVSTKACHRVYPW